VTLAVAAGTYMMVRQPLLFSDTTYHKYFESGSYRCPNVPRSWKPGVHLSLVEVERVLAV
jgi:hypothetical protein